jgi:hypothetical protein
MKTAWLGLTVILSLTIAAAAFADHPVERVKRDAVEILRTKYPDAEFVQDKHQPYVQGFSNRMREFVIYRLNKVGEWQNPRTQQGPDRGGLSVRFYIQEGRWEGALKSPHIGTQDLYVFKETHVVKESKTGKWHIWAEIVTPRVDASEEVKNRLVRLFSDFESYLPER